MTEKYYQDGTEPTVLPHFMTCHGPCEQGNKPCPCPMACESPEDFNALETLGKLIIWFLALVGAGVLFGVFL